MSDAIDEAQARMLAAQELDLSRLDTTHEFVVLYRDRNGRVKSLDLKGKRLSASDVAEMLFNRGVNPARGGRYARGYYDHEMGRPVIKGNDPEIEAKLTEQLSKR